MSQAQITTMTVSEFLDWEARQETKHEFDGVRPVAMTGGTIGHSVVTGNLITALNNRLRGHRCRAVGPDVKVQIGNSIRYPDALVFCGPIAPEELTVPEPVVIFEVLSPTTARED